MRGCPRFILQPIAGSTACSKNASRLPARTRAQLRCRPKATGSVSAPAFKAYGDGAARDLGVRLAGHDGRPVPLASSAWPPGCPGISAAVKSSMPPGGALYVRDKVAHHRRTPGERRQGAPSGSAGRGGRACSSGLMDEADLPWVAARDVELYPFPVPGQFCRFHGAPRLLGDVPTAPSRSATAC